MTSGTELHTAVEMASRTKIENKISSDSSVVSVSISAPTRAAAAGGYAGNASRRIIDAADSENFCGADEHSYKLWVGQKCTHSVGPFYAGDTIKWQIFIEEIGMTADFGIHLKSQKSIQRHQVMEPLRTDLSSGSVVVPEDFAHNAVDFEVDLDNQFAWFAPKDIKIKIKYEARQQHPTFKPALVFLRDNSANNIKTERSESGVSTSGVAVDIESGTGMNPFTEPELVSEAKPARGKFFSRKNKHNNTKEKDNNNNNNNSSSARCLKKKDKKIAPNPLLTGDAVRISFDDDAVEISAEMSDNDRWIAEMLPELMSRCQHDEVLIHLQRAQDALLQLQEEGVTSFQ